MANQYILSFGNSAMSFGGASAGWQAPYAPTLPYLIFEFSASAFTPTSGLDSGRTSRYGTWTQISSSPNRWYWEGWSANQLSRYYGWPFAFCDGDYHGLLRTQYLGGGTCKVVGYGNLDYTSGGAPFMDMDRTFSECTGLTEFVTIQTPNTMTNVGGCFQGCTELVGGALDQYTYWSTYNTGISNHSGTFTNAGANTVTGLAELDQIPTGWGGNLMPVSHTYSATKQNSAAWLMGVSGTDVAIPFDNLGGALNIFTTVSVSAYAGVNMRKSNIWNRRNSFSTSGATYYYPMFWQAGPPYYPTASSPNIPLTWICTTSMYNGTLPAGTSTGDMPGTLDYSTYGSMDKEFGTYSSGRDVYFGFLVLNAPIDSSFDWASTPFGIHSNSNFRDSVINWFIE